MLALLTQASAEASEVPVVEVPLGWGLAVLVVGVLAWARLAPRLGTGLLGPRSALPARPPVTWWAVEMFAVAFLVLVAGQVALLLLGALGGSALDGLLATEISLVAGSALAWFLARRKGREAGTRGLGFRAPLGAGRELSYGLLALVLAAPGIVGVLLLAPALLELLGNEPAVQPVLAGILELEGAALVVAVLLASLLGPFLEELLFRGFVQPACVDRVGASGGIAFTALLFASIHDTDAMLPVFALALLLGHLRHRTGGLLAPVLAHCVWNGSTLALALGFA